MARIKIGVDFTVHLRPSDYCIPVCNNGLRLSQVMHLVLRGLYKRVPDGDARVSLPHGSVKGYDPYCGYETRKESLEDYAVATTGTPDEVRPL